MKNDTTLFIILLNSLLLLSCEPEYSCPEIKCDENTTCKGIGKINLPDGYPTYGFFVDDCDFQPFTPDFNLHPNDFDYAAQTCNGGIRLFFNQVRELTSIHLLNGWNGSTSKGLKISDPIEKFQTLYSNADDILYDIGSYGFNGLKAPLCTENTDEIFIKAYSDSFDQNDRISYIIISY